MPKQEDNINTSKEIQDKGDRKTHKWSVWSQGPDNAKETTRKFKQTTPGQVRDYKHFVNKRRFQRFEQVESVQPKNEDAPANSVAGGGVDMAPNAKGTKVFMKKFRVDGRTKEYREANRRIKERQERIAQRQVQAKLDMFGVHANPFAEETESKKYLDTKEGSIEDAIIKALTNLDNPNDERETLTLPKKDVEVEEGFGKLKDASKNLSKMHKAMGIKKDKTTTKKTAKGGIVQTSTYKKANEEKKSGYLEPDMKKRQANNEKARKDMKKMGTPMKNPHLEEVEEARGAPTPKNIQGPARRYSSPLDSPNAIAAREKLRKVMRGIKKKDPDHPAVQNVKEEEVEIDELSNKTMSSYAQKASASQSDAEKKQDYKTADKRIAGKLRATRRKFSNDTNRILVGLKKESKETENGERDAGSDKYTNYTKEMTPGQGITNPDAKKADVRKKKEQAAQQQQLNVDEDMKYLNTKEGSIEEAITKALRPEAFTTKHEKGDKHTEVPEKKAGETDKDHKDRQAGRVSFKQHRRSLDKVDPDELQGKHADRDDKDIDNDGDSDSSDRYLHRRRQAIASRRKKEDQKESIAPKQLSSPAPAGKNVKKTAAYKSGVRRSKASGEIHHKDDTHHTGTQRHMDDNLPQEKGSGHSTYHKDTRGKKKVRGSKQAHEAVEVDEKYTQTQRNAREIARSKKYKTDIMRLAKSATNQGKNVATDSTVTQRKHGGATDNAPQGDSHDVSKGALKHQMQRGKKKVPGSKTKPHPSLSREEVELTPMEQFEQLVTEKHKASKGRLRSPEGKPSDMKWKYKFSADGASCARICRTVSAVHVSCRGLVLVGVTLAACHSVPRQISKIPIINYKKSTIIFFYKLKNNFKIF